MTSHSSWRPAMVWDDHQFKVFWLEWGAVSVCGPSVSSTPPQITNIQEIIICKEWTPPPMEQGQQCRGEGGSLAGWLVPLLCSSNPHQDIICMEYIDRFLSIGSTEMLCLWIRSNFWPIRLWDYMVKTEIKYTFPICGVLNERGCRP